MKSKKKQKKVIFIVGPTASGKTSLSLNIAESLNTDIISFDSRQLYKELSIGTAVPKKEELKKIKHYFIQHISILNEYNVGIFEKEVIKTINRIHKEKDTIIAVGGSGLYMNAICEGIDDIPQVKKEIRIEISHEFNKRGIQWLQEEVKKYDPKFFANCDKKNPKRLIRALEVYKQTNKPISYFRRNEKIKRPFEIIKIGIKTERDLLYKNINNRVDKMIGEGLLEEVRKLIPHQKLNALQTIGYKELFSFYNNTYSLEESIEEIKKNTRRFAKRQITWFNQDKEITWFAADKEKEIKTFIGL